MNFINTLLHSAVNWGNIFAILLLDIVLSGDNALVVGAAAAGLPRRRRTAAIVVGMGLALVFRLILVSTITLLLSEVPLISLLAGVILAFIAYRLMLTSESEAATGADAPATLSFGKAVLVILIADVTMSLDNIIAIGAIANGNLLSVMIGLIMSILLLIIGSSIVSGIIARYSWLMYGAALFVAWIANQQIWQSLLAIAPTMPMRSELTWVVPGLLPTIMAVLALRRLLKKKAVK